MTADRPGGPIGGSLRRRRPVSCAWCGRLESPRDPLLRVLRPRRAGVGAGLQRVASPRAPADAVCPECHLARGNRAELVFAFEAFGVALNGLLAASPARG